MKQYVIDGLGLDNYRTLKEHLDRILGPPSLGAIYWVELEEDILTQTQKDHDRCAPHVFALELDERALSCELLVRIKTNIKCDCMGYATPVQREWLIRRIDTMLDELGIVV